MVGITGGVGNRGAGVAVFTGALVVGSVAAVGAGTGVGPEQPARVMAAMSTMRFRRRCSIETLYNRYHQDLVIYYFCTI